MTRLEILLERAESEKLVGNTASSLATQNPEFVDEVICNLSNILRGPVPGDYQIFLRRFPDAVIYNVTMLTIYGTRLTASDSDQTDLALLSTAVPGALNVVDQTRDWNKGEFCDGCQYFPDHIVIGECSSGHPFIMEASTSGAVYYFDIWAAGGSSKHPSNFRYKVGECFSDFVEVVFGSSGSST